MFRLRGATFFKQLKYDFLLLLVDTNEEKINVDNNLLHYCNEVHVYVNSG